MPAKGTVPEISELLTVTGQLEHRNKKQRDPLDHVADISLILPTWLGWYFALIDKA